MILFQNIGPSQDGGKINLKVIVLALMLVANFTSPILKVSAQVNPRHGIPDSILVSSKKCISYADEILQGKRPLAEGASMTAVYIAKIASIAGQGEYQVADSLFTKLVEDSADVIHPIEMKSIYQARAGYMVSMGLLSEAEEQATKCVLLSKEMQDTATLAMCLNNLGSAILWQGRDEEALTNYFRAYSLVQNIDHSTTKILLLENIAVVYARRDSFRLAIEYCQKGINERIRLIGYTEMGMSYGNLAYYRMASGLMDDSAAVLLQKSEEAFVKDGQLQYLPWIYNLGGYFYGESRDAEMAKNYMLKGLRLLSIDENPYESVRIMSGLAANYGRLDMPDSSFYYLHEAASLVPKTQDLALHISYLKIKAEVEREFGKFQEAVDTYETILVLQDSLAQSEQRRSLDEILERYKVEQVQNSLLEKEVELLEASAMKQRLWVMVVVILLCFVLVVAYNQNRSNRRLRKTNTLLEELSQKDQRIEELQRLEGITLDKLNRHFSGHDVPISIAEFEVIQLIIEQDASIKVAEMASRLNVSYDTVKSRKRAIARKLNSESSTNEAILRHVMEICKDMD